MCLILPHRGIVLWVRDILVDMVSQILNPEIENIGQHHRHIELSNHSLGDSQGSGQMGNRNNVTVTEGRLGTETEIEELIEAAHHLFRIESLD